MAYNQSLNRGALFKNTRKELDTHPDYTGELNVGGQLYFIDGWLKDSINGKFLSIAIKLKDKQPTEIEGL